MVSSFMNTAYLGLGSNRGDRQVHLQAAVEGLADVRGVRLTGVSPVYETEAHTLDPEEEQPAFFNAVVEAHVTCSPDELLERAQALEAREGRVRDEADRWAPRPLDVDLLAIGAITCETDTLTLPHPRLAERRFVLQPWADLAPEHRVPSPFEMTVRRLLEQCPDTASIDRHGDRLSLPGRSGPES